MGESLVRHRPTSHREEPPWSQKITWARAGRPPPRLPSQEDFEWASVSERYCACLRVASQGSRLTQESQTDDLLFECLVEQSGTALQ